MDTVCGIFRLLTAQRKRERQRGRHGENGRDREKTQKKRRKGRLYGLLFREVIHFSYQCVVEKKRRV